MSGFPPALAAHVGRAVTTVCHCWRLTRADGMAMGFTDHDETLSFDGTQFEPQAGFGASEAKATLGLTADTAEVEGALSSERLREEDIAAGLYDGATVETFLVNWREPEERTLLRRATIGKISRLDERLVAELEGVARTLELPGGRTVSRRCDAELGDGRCRVNLATPEFSGGGTVVSVGGERSIAVAGLDGFAAGWFAHGVLSWTAGALAGRTERVEEHRRDGLGTVLVLRPGGGHLPHAGDAFTIVAGCDKSFATCKAKFSNRLNFRGFPHLPGNDAAYAYVVDGGVFDGGAIVR